MSVSIVVLTFNRLDSVRELLEHLEGLREHVVEVIVVDNASEDGTDRLVAEHFPWARLLRNDTNVGACGRNPGILQARGDVVVTLDDDIFGLTPADLERIDTLFRDDPSLAVLNFRVDDFFTGEVCNWVHHRPSSWADSQFETYEITEGAAALRRSAFESVEGYWEPFFIGHEGPDLAFRLMDEGYRVCFDGRIAVRHKHESAARVSWRFYYYDTRNQILLAARRMRTGMAVRRLFVGLGAMAVYSVRDGFFYHWIRGIVDGCRLLGQAWTTRSPMKQSTIDAVRRIDEERPSFWTQARKRLSGGANRLDG